MKPNEETKQEITPRRESEAGLNTGLSVFDSGTFESLYRVAEALAASSLVPKTLQGDSKQETVANCLRVCEQASRWGLSPFAVVDCASVVYGRLMWEGKLVAAVVDAKLSIRLDYKYEGEGEEKRVTVIGKFADEEEPRTVSGTVAQWRTDGKGSPWENPNNHERQLAYRGAREWARRHAPAVMLGVYTPDEFDGVEMRDVTPRSGRRPQIRQQPLDPQNEAEPVSESETETEKPKEKPDPKPEKTPATGRQKKDRHHRDCTFEGITEKQSASGKTYWAAQFHVGKKSVELTNWSRTLAENLVTLDPGTPMRITFVAGKNGFDLEDYEITENAEEGELV